MEQTNPILSKEEVPPNSPPTSDDMVIYLALVITSLIMLMGALRYNYKIKD